MSLHLLEDQPDFVVVHKPAGVLVHANKRFPHEYPVLQRLRDQLGHYVWPVHRLDRQTSGCILFAKHQECIEPLAQSLRAGQKVYWAFVRGYFPHRESFWVEHPIKSERGHYREARSQVRCISGGKEPRVSLMEVHLDTGRRHQVRRHLRDINHPILHDGDHGDSKVNRMWKANYGLNRLALHAAHLSFLFNGRSYDCFSPLPSDLYQVFSTLPWWQEAFLREPRLAIRAEE